MANINISQIRMKRGNTAAASNYVGPLGELLVDTGLQTVRVQDGATPGGMSTLATNVQIQTLTTAINNITANTSGLYSNSNVASYLPTSSIITGIRANVTAANAKIATLQTQVYANANVASYLPAYTGDIKTNLINFVHGGQINSNDSGAGGATGIAITANINNDINGFYVEEGTSGYAQIYTEGSIRFYTDTPGAAYLWTLGTDGTTSLPGSITVPDTLDIVGNINFTASPGGSITGASLVSAQELYSSGNLTVVGNLFVNGTSATINTSTLIVDDNIIYMANANPANSLDIGFAGHFVSGTYQHTGLVRQASTGQWKLFSNIVTEPGNAIDFTNAVYDAIQVGAISSPTITDLYSNASVQSANIATLFANAGVQSANIATLQSNAASQATDITTLYTNAASQATSINTINANIGAYHIWANANTAGLYNSITAANTNISATQANIGSFYTYANLNYGTSSYANANVAAYLVANPPAGTYSNTNVAAYLAGNTVTTINTTGNITTVANVIGTTFRFANGVNILSTVSAGLAAPSQSNSNTNYNIVMNNSGTLVYGSGNGGTAATLNPYTGYISVSGMTIGGYGVTALTGFDYVVNLNSRALTFTQTGNLSVPGNVVATSAYYGTQYNFANGVNILSTIAPSSTYSNANIVANLQNYVTSISTTANITTTANMISPNYLFANGVNILSTITGGSGTYSNANVVANLQNFVTNIVSTANITAGNVIATQYGNSIGTTATYTGNVQAAYFTGNGSALTGLTYSQVGNIYGSSSNVSLVAGAYTWTFDNTGNLVIPTASNIIYANGTVFSSGSGSGGTTYTNANVVSMLAANTYLAFGNVVTTYPTLANVTMLFVGNNTTIATGSASAMSATHILNNAYFGANGAMYARNTYASGIGQFYIDGGNFYWNAQSTATANAVAGLGSRMSLTGTTLATLNGTIFNSAGLITAAGGISVTNSAGITTNQSTFPLVNATATTISFGNAATTIYMGSSTIGSSGSNVFVGNAIGTSSGNLTVRAFGTYNSVNSLNSSGGYGTGTFSNIAVTGGSGTGMIISMTGIASGYLSTATITNPGTGYRNGETITIPAGNPSGSLGGSFVVGNYNAAYSGQGLANYTFGMDGNLTLPGNLTIASVGSIRYANGTNILSTVTGTYSNSNVTAYLTTDSTVTALQANLGVTQIWANANIASINANLGVTQIWANANIASINANLGAYQTYANTTNSVTQANIGSYYAFANANVSGLYNSITGANTTISALQANVGSFYTYANATYSTGGGSTYSNTNVAAYLTTATITTTGNITAANIVTSGATSGNISGANWISANSFQVSNGIFWSNGTAWSSAGGGTTYSNSNVASYLTAGNITVGTAGFTVLPNIVAQFTSNVNSYGQINMQNINSGAASTTEIVATANNGTDTVFFVDMGIAGNAYNNASPNNSLGTIIYANDAYLYAQGNTSANVGGNLAIGAATAGRNVTIFAGGINNSSNVATFANTGMTVYGNITAANIITTGTYGNITNANVISANNLVVTTTVRTIPVTFAVLPTAASAGAGARAFITDGNTATFGGQVGGSGANAIPVYSNGTNWYVG